MSRYFKGYQVVVDMNLGYHGIHHQHVMEIDGDNDLICHGDTKPTKMIFRDLSRFDDRGYVPCQCIPLIILFLFSVPIEPGNTIQGSVVFCLFTVLTTQPVREIPHKSYPLAMANIALEHGHRNSGFTEHHMVIFHSYVKVYQG